MSDLVLVGDTGGTNTRFALADAASGQLHHIRQFRNAAHATYGAAISAYLAEVGQPPVTASVLAFAAPITEAKVHLTNHDWTITKEAVHGRTGGRAPLFLNDLEALAWSLDLLPEGGVESIAAPVATPPEGGRLVIGIGTGFNAAVLEGGLGENRLPPVVRVAECGHMTLPIETAEELSLRDHLARGRGRASVERALSGLGLVEVHAWACAHLGQPAQTLAGDEITRRGLAGSDPACQLTCEMLVRFAARIAGDLALAYLPFGGIYLAGSVTQALRPLIQTAQFRQMFTAKGRQSDLLAGFPLHILTNGTAALHGCAALALSQQQTASES